MRRKLITACNSRTDLLGVMSCNGADVTRVEGQIDAADTARDGDAVRILADGYPESLTSLDASIFVVIAAERSL